MCACVRTQSYQLNVISSLPPVPARALILIIYLAVELGNRILSFRLFIHSYSTAAAATTTYSRARLFPSMIDKIIAAAAAAPRSSLSLLLKGRTLIILLYSSLSFSLSLSLSFSLSL